MLHISTIVFVCYILKGFVMSTTLTIRMDEQLKQDFLEVVSEIGLDAPTVIRMLAIQTVKQRRVPLSLSADLTTDNTMEFLDDYRADWGAW